MRDAALRKIDFILRFFDLVRSLVKLEDVQAVPEEIRYKYISVYFFLC